jgi:thiol-disulfide isomerase/thioredoxin
MSANRLSCGLRYLSPANCNKVIWGSILVLLSYVDISLGQYIHVRLDTLTTGAPSAHLELFTKRACKQVKLPLGIDTIDAHYLSVFYSWQITDAPSVVAMVIPSIRGERLSIDKNNNMDLTDDGEPGFFPADSNSYDFSINCTKDTEQTVTLRFCRTPNGWNYPDSVIKRYFDNDGNLNPKFARFVGMMHNDSNFIGQKGTYYWDDRVNTHIGCLTIDGESYSIGLNDYGNNGLFNDSDDVFMLNDKGYGNLDYNNSTQNYKINDVFTISHRNFKIHDFDKYGKWIDFEETSEAPTRYFIAGLELNHAKSAQKIKIDPSLWDINELGIDGKTVSLRAFKGKYLLLNFWGEWCKPCLQEIPYLLNARKRFAADQIAFVSFIKIGNLDNAKKLIHDSQITWLQIPLRDEILQKFKIDGFPTNMLISPNGTDCVLTNSVSDSFFEMYVK